MAVCSLYEGCCNSDSSFARISGFERVEGEKKERTINGSFFPFLPNDLLLIKKSENLIKLLDVEKRVKHSKKEQP